ncbi:hypothetical protein MCOR25_005720 [Pyricularia grisea]|uniref:DUF1996 domain-containing protein n=1 Tax=Pyricularia grisea TaxID=148305 RepID=A0A6P8AQD9_PYRGI|nr:uncharacterized protein PgNI_12192 [Pyricularia grisea]KAI6363986.1 hypothetical protein MCOR25_005720 [Pyricularia grisea]TLD04254.1 hypothetical protein PgNI_12192 [Pyricularia grisea]
MQLSTIVKAFVLIIYGVATTVACLDPPTTDGEPAYDCKHNDNFDSKFANKAKVSGSSHMHTYGNPSGDLYIAPSKPQLEQPPCFRACPTPGRCQGCRAYDAQVMAARAAINRQIRDDEDEQPTKRLRWKFWHKRPADRPDPDEHVTVSHGDGSCIEAMNLK